MTLPEGKKAVIWPPFSPLTEYEERLRVVSAKGNRIFLDDGRSLLDGISSWWTNLHGHGHPALVEAVSRQGTMLDHVIFAGFTHAPAEQLANRLIDRIPGAFTRVFYSDNGSTAIEVALKLSIQYWINAGAPRKKILAFDGAYHGDTFGAMSAGARGLFTGPYEPFLFDVLRAPFPETWAGDPDVEEKEEYALQEIDAILQEHHGQIAACIVEPLIQGAAGMRMCSPGFIQTVGRRMKNAGILTIFDEVMTGFGRTGTVFAAENIGFSPDMMALSKGITGGVLPLGATLIGETLERMFLNRGLTETFFHGHSYAGNPVACAAGIASFDLLIEAKPSIDRITAFFRETSLSWQKRPPAGLTRARSTGCVFAVDLVSDGSGYGSVLSAVLRAKFVEAGILLRPLGRTIYVLPPYCTTNEELSFILDQIVQIASEV